MTSELRPVVEVLFDTLVKWDDCSDWDYVTRYRETAAVIEADREAVRAEQAAELAKWKEQRLLDHGRLLWREDVETHCPNADLCFEYSATVRCSPCAIKQSDAEGVEALSLNNVYQPEVARLNRELAKFKALAETLAGALGEAVTWNSHDDEGVPAVWLDQADVALRQYKEAHDER